jgi:DNA repair exonuclease SbcCD ATPase subunit
MILKNQKIDESLKEYKRIKVDYPFFSYIDELERGELPDYILNEDGHQGQIPNQNARTTYNQQYERSAKRGIRSWEYYVNCCELGVELSIPECEHIGQEKLEIYESLKETEAELQKLRPNIQAIDEYKNKLKNLKTHQSDLSKVANQEKDMKAKHESLRRKRYEEFMKGFEIISKELKDMYQTITMGGDAELELVDHLDPFSEGINFSVRPLKKTWKQISKLSGGEKTLSSLSLIFALHHFKPTPLYFMDEIDAALDYKNVAIVANYIKKKARNAQFLIISLRQNMFELANKMVGIYKINDITRTIAVTPKKIVIYFTKILNENNNDNKNEKIEERKAIKVPKVVPKPNKENIVLQAQKPQENAKIAESIQPENPSNILAKNLRAKLEKCSKNPILAENNESKNGLQPQNQNVGNMV